MRYLANHVTTTQVSGSGRYGSLYPEEIEYLNRPVTKDADQPRCAHCECTFTEHCAGWFVGACRNGKCKSYNPF